MRFEVIFRDEPLGQLLSRVVEADGFDAAAIQAAHELDQLGRLGDGIGLPLPITIRRIVR